MVTVQIEELTPCRKRLRIEVSADQVTQVRKEVVGRFTQIARLPGYRPGKAPIPLVEKQFQKEIDEELQKMLDQRIGMNMLGDMNRYTQFQVAQSMPIAAGNEGGGAAGMGAGLGAGMVMAQQMLNDMKPPAQPEPPAAAPQVSGGPAAPAAGGATKFCLSCGKPIPKPAKFCPECGGAQQ